MSWGLSDSRDDIDLRYGNLGFGWGRKLLGKEIREGEDETLLGSHQTPIRRHYKRSHEQGSKNPRQLKK